MSNILLIKPCVIIEITTAIFKSILSETQSL
ncbi:hypothetical protein KM800_03670 [Clostridium tyrobutyricum]|nr:hypothetical protein [Clostridium tyrobutyricum]